MLIRLPWLISRRRLIAAVLLDATLFAALYPVCFQLRYGSWPESSAPLALLMLFWLVTSYVHGRYYDHEDPRANPALKQLLRSLLALLISLAVYLGSFSRSEPRCRCKPAACAGWPCRRIGTGRVTTCRCIAPDAPSLFSVLF